MSLKQLKPDFRKKLLIEPQSQKKIIFSLLKLSFAMTFINLMSLLFVLKMTLSILESTELLSQVLFDTIIRMWIYLVGGSFTVCGIMILYAFFHGLYLSNKIIGPIHQVKLALERVLSGQKGVKLSFRSDDYFQDLSAPLNELIQKYDKKSNSDPS